MSGLATDMRCACAKILVDYGSRVSETGVMSYSQELRKVILELTKAVVSKEGGFSEWRYSTPAGQDWWHPYG